MEPSFPNVDTNHYETNNDKRKDRNDMHDTNNIYHTDDDYTIKTSNVTTKTTGKLTTAILPPYHQHHHGNRRPVKKRQVVHTSTPPIPTVPTAATTSTIPDLIHEMTMSPTGQSTMTMTTTIAANVHNHIDHNVMVSVSTTNTSTVLTPLKAASAFSTTKKSSTSPPLHLLSVADKKQYKQELACDDSHDDDDDDDDNIGGIPSPPLFVRSMAQVIQHPSGGTGTGSYAANMSTTMMMNQPSSKTTTTIKRVAPVKIIVSTSDTPGMTRPANETNQFISIASSIPNYAAAVAAAVPFQTIKHHRRSIASIDFDDRFYFDSSIATITIPPLTDDLASLSLTNERSSSLSQRPSPSPLRSLSMPGAVIFKHKNYNKVLPVSSVRCPMNTKSLLVDHTETDKVLTELATKNRFPMSCSEILHSISSDVMDSMATLTPTATTTTTVPPQLMAGKVISTKYGLAMLLVPSLDITPTDYANTFASSAAMHALPNNGVTSSQRPISFPAAVVDIATLSGTVTRFKHWLKSEDDLLHYAITKQSNGPPYMWQEIAHTYFPNTRNANQCKSRWKKIDPTLVKNPFTRDEDEIILKEQGVGLTWPDIAAKLPGRNSDQVRARFTNSINPALMKNVAWTVEEDRILHAAQGDLGNKWSVIASLLPGRSENDLKNHWHNQRLKAKRKLQSIAAVTKRNEILTNLRNSRYDRNIPIQDHMDIEEMADVAHASSPSSNADDHPKMGSKL